MPKVKRNIRIFLVIFCLMFAFLAIYFSYSVYTYGNTWFASPYNTRVTAQRDSVIVGEIRDRTGAVLAGAGADGKRVYADSEMTRLANSQLVGDTYGMCSTGAEYYMAQYLLGFNQGFFERIVQTFTGAKRQGDDVVLTVDSKLNAYAYDLVSGYDAGAAVIMNYKTGEILCSVSAPGYDPTNMSAYLPSDDAEREDNGEFTNRVTQGRYTPGSVFKLVTAAGALRDLPGVTKQTFDCSGQIKLKNGTLADNDGEVHDQLNLATALAVSCNSTFAAIGLELGRSRMQAAAERLGFNQEFSFEDLTLYTSKYVLPASASDELNFAWSCDGQYKDVVTPLHMCMITGAIANGGDMMTPKLLKAVLDGGTENAIKSMTSSVYKTVMTDTEASTLGEMMKGVVEYGTGQRAQIDGYTVAGKTGTAQVSDDKSVENHAWFVGYIDSDESPLAIAVVLEHAGSGGSKAAPVAQQILSRALELGY